MHSKIDLRVENIRLFQVDFIELVFYLLRFSVKGGRVYWLISVEPMREYTGSAIYMLHPIREIAHFINWPYYSCPFHELGNCSFIFSPSSWTGQKYEEASNLTSNSTNKSAQYMKWEISRI
jgi:hypothetical protein